MIFYSTYNSKTEVYLQNLKKIKSIKFSIREIDTAVCILHNRGEKKIAMILNIMPKTVNAHVYNIMQKLHCNSRDQIIDFFEKSEKLQYLREYYLHLMILSSFEKQLKRIGSVLNPSKVTCYIDYNQATESELKLLSHLEQHLLLANIALTNNLSSNEISANKLYIINEALSSPTSNTYSLGSSIVLLFNKTTDVSTLRNLQYADFSSEENYYFSIFRLIEKIIYKDNIDQIIQEFKSEYESLQKSWQGVSPSIKKDLTLWSFSINKKLVLKFFIVSIIVVCSLILVFYKEKPNIDEINKVFAEFTEKFSADNISTPEKIRLNYSFLNIVEKNIGFVENKGIQQYFISSEVPEQQLLNYLYVCHALANQYIFIQHNGLKGRKLLFKAKYIAEQYIKNKNNLAINFDELNSEEIYNEFNIVKDLPELYIRIMYLLGRSFVYQDDLKDSYKYFKLAKDLGSKLKIFEGYLSIRSGLEFLQAQEIIDDINNNRTEQARIKLLASIETNHRLLEDGQEYIINYQPGKVNQETIIPKNDLFNQVFCKELIAKYYAKLIFLTQDASLQQKYLKEIYGIYIGNNLTPGLIKICESAMPKIAASALNILGYILLKLYENHIDFTQFKKALVQKLHLNEVDEYSLIEHVFNIAKSKARNTDYIKADSYDGLIKLYELKHKNANLSFEAKKELKKEIESCGQKRDKINKNLNRDGWRLNKHKI